MRKIVTRHSAAVEFIRWMDPAFADAPVLASATAEDVEGHIVAGNIPLHLAAKTQAVIAVEFSGPAPRGVELTLADMVAAGAYLAAYTVFPVGGDADND
jgi:hypothetical protein